MFFLSHHSGFIYNRLSEDQERVDIQLTKSEGGGRQRGWRGEWEVAGWLAAWGALCAVWLALETERP